MSYRVPHFNSGDKDFQDDMTLGGSLYAASGVTANNITGNRVNAEDEFSVGTTPVVFIDEILDEDDFSSDSNTGLATQQSIKAYIDDRMNNLMVTGVTGTGATVVDSFPDTPEDGCIWHYNIITNDGTGYMTGTISAAWDSGTDSIEFNESSTLEAGDADDFLFSVDINSNNVRLIATLGASAGAKTWTVKLMRIKM